MSTPLPPIKLPQPDTGKPDISLAPLVDVVFLLLIFFMVTTVFPESHGLIIEKPSSQHSDPLSTKRIIFSIDRQGIVRYKGQEVTRKNIVEVTRSALGKNPDMTILIHTDQGAPVQKLIDVMDAGKQGGAEQLSVATDARDQR